MPFDMPNHLTVMGKGYYDKIRNAEQRKTTAANEFNRFDSCISSMSPLNDKSILTEGIRYAMARQDNDTY